MNMTFGDFMLQLKRGGDKKAKYVRDALSDDEENSSDNESDDSVSIRTEDVGAAPEKWTEAGVRMKLKKGKLGRTEAKLRLKMIKKRDMGEDDNENEESEEEETPPRKKRRGSGTGKKNGGGGEDDKNGKKTAMESTKAMKAMKVKKKKGGDDDEDPDSESEGDDDPPKKATAETPLSRAQSQAQKPLSVLHKLWLKSGTMVAKLRVDKLSKPTVNEIKEKRKTLELKRKALATAAVRQKAACRSMHRR